jgi:hypothetical protein
MDISAPFLGDQSAKEHEADLYSHRHYFILRHFYSVLGAKAIR